MHGPFHNRRFPHRDRRDAFGPQPLRRVVLLCDFAKILQQTVHVCTCSPVEGIGTSSLDDDQAARGKDLQMLGRVGDRQRRLGGNVGYGPRPLGEQLEKLEPMRIGDGGRNACERSIDVVLEAPLGGRTEVSHIQENS